MRDDSWSSEGTSTAVDTFDSTTMTLTDDSDNVLAHISGGTKTNGKFM